MLSVAYLAENLLKDCYYQNMNKNLPKKAKDIKGKVALAELRRSHYIIVILALSFAATLGFVSVYEVRFNGVLAAIACVLLMLVTVASLATALVLRKR